MIPGFSSSKYMANHLDGPTASALLRAISQHENEAILANWEDIDILGELGINPEDDSDPIEWAPGGKSVLQDRSQHDLQMHGQNGLQILQDFSGMDPGEQIRAGVLGIYPQAHQQYMSSFGGEVKQAPYDSDYSENEQHDESDFEELPQRPSKKRRRDNSTPSSISTTVFTTSSGHKRGPLNGGLFIPAKRDTPPWIPTFVPMPYKGPRVHIKGSQSPFNTQGKRVPIEQKSIFKPST